MQCFLGVCFETSICTYRRYCTRAELGNTLKVKEKIALSKANQSFSRHVSERVELLKVPYEAHPLFASSSFWQRSMRIFQDNEEEEEDESTGIDLERYEFTKEHRLDSLNCCGV